MNRIIIFLILCYLSGFVGFITTEAGYGWDTITYWLSIGCVTAAFLLGREYESR